MVAAAETRAGRSRRRLPTRRSIGGGAPDGATGGGGQGGAPGVACGTLTLSSTIVLAPAAAGQNYVRCQTLGPETGWQVVLSPTGDRLAARTGAGTLRLLATDTWTEIAQLGSPLGAIDAVAFSPDGATLATLSAEMGEVALWSAHDGTFQRSFAGPPASGCRHHRLGAGVLFRRRPAGDVAGDGDRSRQRGDDQLADRRRPDLRAGGQSREPRLQRGGGRHPAHPFHRRRREALRGDRLSDRKFPDQHAARAARSGDRGRRSSSTTSSAVVSSVMRSRRTGARWRGRRRPRRGHRDSPPAWPSSMRPAGRSWRSIPSFSGTVIGFSRDGAQLFVETGTTVSASAPPTCIPSVSLSCPRASSSWAFRPRTSWSARCPGRPPGGTRPPARSSRPRAIRSPPRPGRRWAVRCRHRRSGRAVSLLARVRRRAALWAAGRQHHARRRWHRWGRPDRPARIRPRPPATAH